jgi:hypothetical protein
VGYLLDLQHSEGEVIMWVICWTYSIVKGEVIMWVICWTYSIVRGEVIMWVICCLNISLLCCF